jgi:hypothetical protein
VNTFTESRATAPPKLRTARLEDYQAIVRLGLTHSLDVPSYEDWSTLWLDNPLRARCGKDFPIGWVLVLPDGEMVGTMGTVRARYTFRGDELISAVSRAWFPTVPYRGFALQLMDGYLNQPGVDLFINNVAVRRRLASSATLSFLVVRKDSLQVCLRAIAQRDSLSGGVLKEAYVKATGKGLAYTPERLTVEQDDNGEPVAIGRCQFSVHRPGSNHVAAAAVLRERCVAPVSIHWGVWNAHQST